MNQTIEWPQTYNETGTRTGACEDVQFNVFEVLRIAEEVEHKATRFFLQAAERFDDPRRRNIYCNLAAWRNQHRQAWARLRREYSERTGEFGRFDPDNYLLSNPQVMASLTCFATHPRSRSVPTGRETAEQIVRDATRRAREAAIFYQGLKGFVRDAESQTMIDAMVGDEERHIRLLSRSLERAQPERSTEWPMGVARLAEVVSYS
jgi:rubrerythrin